MRPFRWVVSFLIMLVFLWGAGCRGKSDSSPRGYSDRTPQAGHGKGDVFTPEGKSPAPASPTPRIIIRLRSFAETSAPYVIRKDHVFFPGYDDRGSTAPPELLRLPAAVFAKTTHIYENRAVCTKPNNETTTFTIPMKASEIGLLLRARAVEDEWPRVRVSLINIRHRTRPYALFEGNIAWRELRYIWWKLPPEWRGESVFLRVEILNPEYHFSQRAVYVAEVILRGPE